MEFVRHNRICDPAGGVRWFRQDVPKLEAVLSGRPVGVSCAEVLRPACMDVMVCCICQVLTLHRAFWHNESDVCFAAQVVDYLLNASGLSATLMDTDSD